MKCVKIFWAAVVLMFSTTALAWAKNPADYPLGVFIVETHYNSTSSGAVGNGHGNLKEGDSVTGFDYTFQCSAPFNPSTGDPLNPSTGYQGRWKKQGTRLAILTVEIGNPKHQSECELKISQTSVIYSVSEGHLVTYTRQQYEDAMAWREAFATMTHPPDTDLTHFPLRVSILEAQWQKHPGGGSMGNGRGNVRNGDSVMAYSFVAPRCAGTLNVVALEKGYAGKWLEESARLLVLSVPVGTTGFYQCELQTKVQPNYVYFKNSTTGVIQTLTQDEYRARREKQKAAQAAQQQPAQAEAKTEIRPAGGPNQKISIASTPDGADIEVDGAFVGSTPSVIELGPGEHSILIRKLGYKPWERKLKLTSGDIKLNAELERTK